MIVVHDVRRLAEVFRSLVKKVPRSAGGEEHVDTFTPIVHLYRIAIHGKGEPTGKPHPLNRYSGFVVNYGGARGDQEDAETEGGRVLVYSHPQPWEVVSRGKVDTVPMDQRLGLQGIVSVSPSAMDQFRALYRREEASHEERGADPGTYRSTWAPINFLPDYDVDERAKREIDRALSSGGMSDFGVIRSTEAFALAFRRWLQRAEQLMLAQPASGYGHGDRLVPDYSGRKYVKVWRQTAREAARGDTRGSIWRFVDTSTGDVYLAKDRNTPKGQGVENIYARPRT